MFEACEAFVWCLKDNFYVIYRPFEKKRKKKSKNFKVAFLDFFFSYFSNGRRSRKNDLSDTKQRPHMLQTL